MSHTSACAVVMRRLQLRGFAFRNEDEACRLGPWMRFTPTVQALLFGLCTMTGSVPVLLALAAVLATGVVTARHPFDWIYNLVIRPLENSPELPASPMRRRMVFLVGVAWCLLTAWQFSIGNQAVGMTLGALMTASTALLAATHICIPSRALALVARGVAAWRRDGHEG